MQLDWEYWMLSFAIPFSVVALAIVMRLIVFMLLSWRAGDWWNRVLENRHDENLKSFQDELRRLDEQQDAWFQGERSGKPDALLEYIASELTRARQRLEVMRIERQAQYDAETARTRFSDFQIVWLWLRHRGNPAGRLDGGTTRPLMDPNDLRDRSLDPTRSTPPGPSVDSSDSGERDLHGNVRAVARHPSMHVPAQAVVTPPIFVITDLLERLALLQAQGALTPDEFAKLKALLLDF